MANVFSVTTVTDQLKAETGKVTTVFTATNTTSRPLRGTARIKPLGNTQQEWLNIEGEAERDFPTGGTQQFTVNFAKDAPKTEQSAEKFQFRLDVVSSSNPDEDFTEGPVVTIEIPEQKTPPTPFPWWILVVAGVLLLAVAGAVAWLLLRGDNLKVPELVGKTYAEAEAELKAKCQEAGLEETCFKIEKNEVIDPEKELDKVFDQNPTAGTEVEKDSTVKLSIPAATTVPPLKQKCFLEAMIALTNRGLDLGIVSGNQAQIANCVSRVSSSKPEENKTVAKGTKVSLTFPCVKTPQNPCNRFTKDTMLDLKDVKVSPSVLKDMKNLQETINKKKLLQK
jgi:hypothetical protein